MLLLRSLAGLLSALASLLIAGMALAVDLPVLVANLTTGSFGDRETAVGALAASGEVRAAPILDALAAGQLYVRKSDNTVVIGKPDGNQLALTEAISGKPAGSGSEAELDPGRVHNRLRGVLQATVRPLPLLKPAARVRREAAQTVWYGISLGSVLLLAAIGLAITFGTMGVINMAHGEMVMLGAYTTFVVQEVIRTSAPHLFDASLVIALPLAFLVSGGIGILIERGIIRFLYGRPLDTLLATWGLSLVLQQAVRSIFGPSNREVGAPSWMSGAFQLGQLNITYGRLWIVVFALVVFAALILLLRRTPLGLYMRAVTQNRPMASAMGIRTPRVDALTFGLGSGIAGLAGVALSQIDNVSPNLGQGYIIDSFMVVVFGGVANLFGPLAGSPPPP